jgi:uncharacterized RDD family membrane protein YckC
MADATAAPAGAPPRPLAGIARRLAALAYELLLLVALWLVAGFALAPLVSPQPGGLRQELVIPSALGRLGEFGVLFTLTGLYLGWSWAGGRRTLPQKTWKLAVVGVDRSAASAGKALTRYLACWIGPALALLAYLALRPYSFGTHGVWLLGLNWLWAWIDSDRQFLHDRIAGTRIVTTS